MVLILILETGAGVVILKGTWDMWSARKTDSEAFNASKKVATMGLGLGILIWLGIFGVIGGAFFQMWQTEIGSVSANFAFQFFASCALCLVFINQQD
jgi:predicted small integral membrane protein